MRQDARRGLLPADGDAGPGTVVQHSPRYLRPDLCHSLPVWCGIIQWLTQHTTQRSHGGGPLELRVAANARENLIITTPTAVSFDPMLTIVGRLGTDSARRPAGARQRHVTTLYVARPISVRCPCPPSAEGHMQTYRFLQERFLLTFTGYPTTSTFLLIIIIHTRLARIQTSASPTSPTST